MMFSVVERGLRSSGSHRIGEELVEEERQGIRSILGCTRQRAEKKGSLRRCFSANISSKKWLAQALKKVPSSEEFSVTASRDNSSSSSASSESEEEQTKELETPSQFDIWKSIQSQKSSDFDSLLNPLYIKPLFKRSSSTLSEKSLQICTESLGSETGSDSFSSYLTSDSSDSDDRGDTPKEEEEEEEAAPEAVIEQNEEIVHVELQNKQTLIAVRQNGTIGKKSPTRSFPPPLPSIFSHDGPRLQMRSHRTDGRLVVEAVSIPSVNILHAQRHDGRLRLSFVNSQPRQTSELIHRKKESEGENVAEAAEQEEEEKEEAKEEQTAAVEEEEEADDGDEEEEEAAAEEADVDEEKIVRYEVKIVGQERRKVIPLMEKQLMRVLHVVVVRNKNRWINEKKMEGQDESIGVSPILSSATFNGYDFYRKNPTKRAPPSKLMLWKKPVVFKPRHFLPVINVCRGATIIAGQC